MELPRRPIWYQRDQSTCSDTSLFSQVSAAYPCLLLLVRLTRPLYHNKRAHLGRMLQQEQQANIFSLHLLWAGEGLRWFTTLEPDSSPTDFLVAHSLIVGMVT